MPGVSISVPIFAKKGTIESKNPVICSPAYVFEEKTVRYFALVLAGRD